MPNDTQNPQPNASPEDQVKQAIAEENMELLAQALARGAKTTTAQLDFLAQEHTAFNDRALLEIVRYAALEQDKLTIPQTAVDRVMLLEDRERKIRRERTGNGLEDIERSLHSLQDFITDLRSPDYHLLRKANPGPLTLELYQRDPNLAADEAHVAASMGIRHHGVFNLMLQRAAEQNQTLGNTSFNAAMHYAIEIDMPSAQYLKKLLSSPQFVPDAELMTEALEQCTTIAHSATHTGVIEASRALTELTDYVRRHPKLAKHIPEKLIQKPLPVREDAKEFVQAVRDAEVPEEHAAELLVKLLQPLYTEKKLPHLSGQPGYPVRELNTVKEALDTVPISRDPEKKERMLNILKETEVELAHAGYGRHPQLQAYLDANEIELTPTRTLPRTSWRTER